MNTTMYNQIVNLDLRLIITYYLPPIICYKYNKPIRRTIFNFNKLVANLDIDPKTPDS